MDDLKEIARQTRVLTLKAIHATRSGHPGGSLSMVEIITLLHCEVMRPQPYYPDTAQDVFILSGGHKCPSLYALWGVLGWVEPESVLTLRKLNSPFQGHPSLRHQPWVRASSGSLGIAYSVAVGMALGDKLEGRDRRTYVLVGDGELHEGVTVEASRIAGHYRLDNLCVILDWNSRMSDGCSRDMTNPMDEFEAWGFQVETCDGHDFDELRLAFQWAFGDEQDDRPKAVLCDTVKGKGVSWMEADEVGAGYHGSVTLSDTDLARALEELRDGQG